MANVRDRYDTVPVTATFTNAAGVATDPTTITFRVLTPAGVETAYVYGVDAALTRTSAGIYVYNLLLAEMGTYRVRYRGTGAVAQAGEEVIDVRYTRFSA